MGVEWDWVIIFKFTSLLLSLMLSSCKLKQSFYSELKHDLARNTVLRGKGADIVDFLLRRGKERFERLSHLEIPRYFRLDLVEINAREQRL